MALVPPPEGRVAIHVARWKDEEERFGFAFPSDFKQIWDRYGPGDFLTFLGLHDPFAVQNGFRYWIDLLSSYYDAVKHNFPELCPFGFYPEPGGLIPWGGDENSNAYFWLPQGEPDSLKVIVYNNDWSRHFLFDGGTAEFIVTLLSSGTGIGFMKCDIPERLPEDFTPT